MNDEAQQEKKRLQQLRNNLRESGFFILVSYIIAYPVPEYLCHHGYDKGTLRLFELCATPFILFTTVRLIKKVMDYRAQIKAYRQRFKEEV